MAEEPRALRCRPLAPRADDDAPPARGRPRHPSTAIPGSPRWPPWPGTRPPRTARRRPPGGAPGFERRRRRPWSTSRRAVRRPHGRAIVPRGRPSSRGTTRAAWAASTRQGPAPTADTSCCRCWPAPWAASAGTRRAQGGYYAQNTMPRGCEGLMHDTGRDGGGARACCGRCRARRTKLFVGGDAAYLYQLRPRRPQKSAPAAIWRAPADARDSRRGVLPRTELGPEEERFWSRNQRAGPDLAAMARGG